jgi:hypothetical protein
MMMKGKNRLLSHHVPLLLVVLERRRKRIRKKNGVRERKVGNIV